MRTVSVIVFICLSFLLTSPVLGTIDLSGQVAATVQSLESEPGNEEVGFGDPRLNLQVESEVARGVTAFAEIHNNRLNPEAAPSDVTEPNEVVLREAYVTLRGFFPKADMMVGRRDVHYGTQHRERSVNARVQDNPLIGNHLTDFGGPETGIHFYSLLRGWGFERVDWNFSLTNGTRSATVNEGTSPAITAGLDLRLAPDLHLKGSWHWVDHDEDVSTGSSFVASDGETYLLEQGISSFVTQRDLWAEVDAWQVDAWWDGERWNLAGYFGVVEVNRDFSSANFDGSKADYWTVQAGWDMSPRTTLSSRWSEFDADEPVPGEGINDGAEVERAQVGVRYEFRTDVFLKAEYVDQSSNLDELKFNGPIGEVSVSF